MSDLRAKAEAVIHYANGVLEDDTSELLDNAVACARHVLALVPADEGDGWLPIESAPKDGSEFIAYSQDKSGSGLPPFASLCSWHPDAGFCTDEIREPTHWIKPPNKALGIPPTTERTHR
jgi:hypothetical protein